MENKNQQRRSRIALTVVCALILTFTLVLPAYGLSLNPDNINNDPLTIGWTTTHYMNEGVPDTWWHQGWGNSMVIDFTADLHKGRIREHAERSVDASTGIAIDPWTLGAHYVLDRSMTTTLNPLTPQLYEHATGVCP